MFHRKKIQEIRCEIKLIALSGSRNMNTHSREIYISFIGVRYNAEKKKVGNYYTTPIYRFRMKCHLCDNHFEIETDPKVGK